MFRGLLVFFPSSRYIYTQCLLCPSVYAGSDLTWSALLYQPFIGQPGVKQRLSVSIWLWVKEDTETAAVSFQKSCPGGKKWRLKAEELSGLEWKRRGGGSAVGGKPWWAGAGTARGGQRGKGEEMKRDEKQGTYFPVYPNLRGAKRWKTGGRTKEREREGRQRRKQELVIVIKDKKKVRVMKWLKKTACSEDLWRE